MTTGLTDIGANLLHGQFDDDRDAVLTRARQAGIERLLVTATDLDVAEASTAFVRAARARADWPRLYTTAGVHPHDAGTVPADWTATLSGLLNDDSVVAVGETGLDYHRNFSPRDIQRQVFDSHVAMACERQLPLFVHDRDSRGEVLEILARHAPDPAHVVIHCFTGGREDLDAYLEAGYFIGITGWVCDRRRGGSLRELVPAIPMNRLLIETDAPFLLPHDLPPDVLAPPRGRRNEPHFLPAIVTRLAELLDVDVCTLTEQTTSNAVRCFNLA
ncbi:MAG: TatD family hydrolase [Pseudomonadales bacterium]|nr:TatD family hydrolase [Pseudomonadales bacterium]MCP5183820.1 TatD family hydrolase [Pseudomonadales bacterium]